MTTIHINGDSPTAPQATSSSQRLFSKQTTKLESFAQLCSQTTKPEQYPQASSITHNVPVYKLGPFASLDEGRKSDLQNEWYRVLLHGPGVFVVSGLFPDEKTIDSATKAINGIIHDEKQGSGAHGDHFAGAGQNERIWNSFGKHCLADPKSFLDYYSNPYLSLIASAWLGPRYRLTAQVNNVKPGGAPQVCHRDYHLGFMSANASSQFPQGAHLASQFLTLQGAVAHMDVPIESGPTRLLPYSQMCPDGFLTYRRPEFNENFLQNFVSLAMKKGDGLFFNPALFHAAGENTSNNDRMANLLQISSAFGKPMEVVDALPMTAACWEDLLKRFRTDGESDEIKAAVAALGEGYAFPTNLDRNPPRSESMAPESEQDVLWTCLRGVKTKDETVTALETFRTSRQA